MLSLWLNLWWGICQGCSFSSFLFNGALELLAYMIIHFWKYWWNYSMGSKVEHFIMYWQYFVNRTEIYIPNLISLLTLILSGCFKNWYKQNLISQNHNNNLVKCKVWAFRLCFYCFIFMLYLRNPSQLNISCFDPYARWSREMILNFYEYLGFIKFDWGEHKSKIKLYFERPCHIYSNTLFSTNIKGTKYISLLQDFHFIITATHIQL